MNKLIGILLVANGCTGAPSTSSEAQELCNNETASCPCPGSPVIIDVAGDGIALTGWEDGVVFGLRPGTIGTLAWTAPDSDDAWLVLDRDGDGVIRDGAEMFGNFTAQAALSLPGEHRIGFRALALLDENADAIVDAKDPAFSRLRLWQDRNHDGVSQADELSALPALGVAGLGVSYEATKLADQHGNAFRYRATVIPVPGQRAGMTAWDVWLTGTRPVEIANEDHERTRRCGENDGQINLHPMDGGTVPAHPWAFQPFSVTWNECNSGSASVGPYQTTVELSGQLMFVSVSYVPPNQCIAKSLSISQGYPAGNHFLKITSDVYDEAYELNEYDNIWQNTVTVQ